MDEKRSQLADKGISTVQMTKVLIKLFQKFVGWRGNALLALRRARNSLTAFLFANFFFAPAVSKKKWGIKFVLFNKLLFLQQGLSVVWRHHVGWRAITREEGSE